MSGICGCATWNQERSQRKLQEENRNKRLLAEQPPPPPGEDLVLEVAEEEIKKTAELLSHTADRYNLVVGGQAAERVAKHAGVSGDLCRSIADPALVKSLSDTPSGWYADQEPTNCSAWLDDVQANLSIEDYTKDKAEEALRHSFASIKAELQQHRGVRNEKRQRGS